VTHSDADQGLAPRLRWDAPHDEKDEDAIKKTRVNATSRWGHPELMTSIPTASESTAFYPSKHRMHFFTGMAISNDEEQVPPWVESRKGDTE
jgi:hypothetical protein